MELKKIEPGYPCHKYLARSIKNEQDLWMYAKAFITTVVSQKTDWDEALSLLIASLADMPSSSGLSCPDFAGIRLTPKDSCLFIMNNDAVPVFKSCNGYYRKKDSKTPCCRLCPLSNIYYNDNEKQEYEVFKYIFTSKDNFDFAMQYFDADFFKSGIDVTMEISMDKACVVPVLKEIVSSALKSNLRLLLFNDETSCFNNATAFDIAWDDAVSRFPRERRIPAKLKNNPMWSNVLKQFIYDRMLGAADITQDDVRDIFSDYIDRSIEQSSSKKEKEPVWIDMYLTDVPLEEPPVSDNPPVIEELPETPVADQPSDNINAEPENNMAEESPIIESPTAAAPIVPPPIEYQLENENTDNKVVDPVSGEAGIIIDQEGTIEEYNHVQNDDRGNDKQPVAEGAAPEDPLPDDASGGEHKTSSAPPVNPPEKRVDDETPVAEETDNGLLLTMNRNMILHLSLSTESAKRYCEIVENGNLPDNAYQGMLRDKSMSVEIVLSDNTCKYAYIVWSRHTKKFYYVSADTVSGNLFEMLSRSMVKKICHTPYLLYGVSRLYNHTVKNVFSIQTAHSRVTEKAAVMSYETLIALYDLEHQFGRGIEASKKEACVFFAGMPFYKGIAHVLTDMLDRYEKPLLYNMDCCVDESVGYSYLYARNFKDTGYLMQLLPDGRQLYKEEFVRSALSDGYFISYTVADSNCAIDMFRYLLYCLSKDGHMRKCNLQLTGMQYTYITFYVTDEYFDYITTVINMYLFEYSSMYPSKIIKVNQLTERYQKQAK